MSLTKKIEVCLLNANTEGKTKFYAPQISHETNLVKLPPNTIEDLFVHQFQTDQLFVVKGNLVLIILQNRQYTYLGLDEQQPTVVKIPPGVPHAAINFNSEPCVMVNALIRHGNPHKIDYRPLKPPMPYDLSAAKKSLELTQQSSRSLMFNQ